MASIPAVSGNPSAYSNFRTVYDIPAASATAGATAQLITAQSGGIININLSANAWTVQLPAASKGQHYHLCISTAGAGVLTIQPTAGTISGYVINNATRLAVAAKASLVTSATTAVGDHLYLYCVDGTNWQVEGFGIANASFA